ncbi:hypothetical protein HYV81_03205 [Candidatus Woesearchaeota archaeon]|nr:hypothetical protein [Candidatus Woesearchaeota archaeon]
MATTLEPERQGIKDSLEIKLAVASIRREIGKEAADAIQKTIFRYYTWTMHGDITRLKILSGTELRTAYIEFLWRYSNNLDL